MLKKLLLSTSLFISAHVAWASVTPAEVPQNLHIYSEAGSTFVDLVPYDCSGSRYYIPNEHIRYETIVSIILAAQISGKKVQFRIDGCNFNNQGKIIGVYLK